MLTFSHAVGLAPRRLIFVPSTTAPREERRNVPTCSPGQERFGDCAPTPSAGPASDNDPPPRVNTGPLRCQGTSNVNGAHKRHLCRSIDLSTRELIEQWIIADGLRQYLKPGNLFADPELSTEHVRHEHLDGGEYLVGGWRYVWRKDSHNPLQPAGHSLTQPLVLNRRHFHLEQEFDLIQRADERRQPLEQRQRRGERTGPSTSR